MLYLYLFANTDFNCPRTAVTSGCFRGSSERQLRSVDQFEREILYNVGNSPNVPDKLKLRHPPRAYPGHLTVILARGGGNWNVALKEWGI